MKRLNLFIATLIFGITLSFAQYKLPALNYDYNALEPFIDSTTMRIHHTGHHQGYVNKLNKALKKYPTYFNVELTELLKNINALPKDIRTAVRNNGGGHYNHTFFWEIMAPAGTTAMSDELQNALVENFGSVDAFKAEFEKAADSHFGSGWIWLLRKADGTLYIASTANQDNMFMPYNNLKGKPILALDVWEHAYYLKFQSKRVSYVQAFWNVVNWNKVSQLYSVAFR